MAVKCQCHCDIFSRNGTMNTGKLWVLKQILKYTIIPQLGKMCKDANLSNLNSVCTFYKFKVINNHNSKRFMGSDTCSKKKEKIGRHCFHKDLENILNQQAIEEYSAAFAYLSMALYFGRSDIALPGCQGFFMNMYGEELSHGNTFVNYVLMRGGSVQLQDIKIPKKKKYGVREAFKIAMQMEMDIKDKLCKVNDIAEKYKDLHVMDWISTEFMEEQNVSIWKMARLYTRSKMVSTPVGEHLFDQFVFKSFVKTEKDNLMNKRHIDFEKDKFNVYK